MKDSQTRAHGRLTYRTPEVNSLGTISDFTASGTGIGAESRLFQEGTPDIIPEVGEPAVCRHYGLTLEVNQDLPRLARADSQVRDVSIEFMKPGQLPPTEAPWVMQCPPAAIWRSETATGSWLRLRYAFEDFGPSSSSTGTAKPSGSHAARTSCSAR